MAIGILERIGERVVKSTPLQRLGGDEDLKGVVVFLASNAARHVTGQCIAVDGGQSSS
jgi:NAD(P)-dependent dehydrogenase (short-subunit alcohol dehydrogenase family)